MNYLRRLAARSPLKSILLHPRVRQVLASILALRFIPAVWQVDHPFSFLAAEVRRAGLRRYRLRASGEPIVVRHDQGGLELLDEIFRQRCYEPPPDVAPLIPAVPRILDVGANVGAFCAYATSRWPESHILAIEADPDNVVALRDLLTTGRSNRFEVLAAAASTDDEPIRFASGLGSGSRISSDGDLVDAVDLLALLPETDLLKLDIEGGEWPILEDVRLADTGPLVVVMEYHRRFPGDTDAQEAATKLLRSAGFEVGHVLANYWGHGTLWAWRE